MASFSRVASLKNNKKKLYPFNKQSIHFHLKSLVSTNQLVVFLSFVFLSRLSPVQWLDRWCANRQCHSIASLESLSSHSCTAAGDDSPCPALEICWKVEGHFTVGKLFYVIPQQAHRACRAEQGPQMPAAL